MNSSSSQSIERFIMVSLPSDRPATEQEVLDIALQLRPVFPLPNDEFEAMLKRLHARLAIKMDVGVFLAPEHRPWLSARKPFIDPFYWDRFRQFLERKDWPPRVISTLDRVTDDVLDLLGNPAQNGGWARRGLVVGDVQSGKTGAYTALCCKAGDAGYRLIIILTGTLESLRRQTQERLDEGFVGLDSSGQLTKIRTSRAVGVGLINAQRAAGVFTSRERDFQQSLLNALGFRLDIFQNPVLVVVKKNKRILENLEDWLTAFNAGPGGKIDAPVLVVDDEADSASINTRATGEDPTAINRRIRSLLHLFTRSSYVGFTATPFANVFIDPDSDDEMVGNDLFPRDFICNLDAPSNYFGPRFVFGEEPPAGVLKPIEDADAAFPEKHKAVLVVGSLPPSLLDAARTYLLSTTIRDLRGEGPTHRSMLVNVSRFTAVQDQVASLLHEWLSRIQQDIRNYSQLPSAKALRNASIAELHATWLDEFSHAGFDWETVQRALPGGTLPVTVQAINQRTGAASLDYAKHRETGLRVIAVGGNSLSRGLTLEGLSTSYFFRNSQMYDTLLQMGRWFGYRDGYQDLCRIWLAPSAISWYSHITSATDELRAEFRKMRQQHLTPKDFGLKVRAHPDSLIVTAQNKMRRSRTIERTISVSKRYLETPRLRRNDNVIRANKITVERFLEALRRERDVEYGTTWGNPLWRGVPKELVAALLRGFDVHPLNVSFQADDLAGFIETTTEPSLQHWDVVVPQGNGGRMQIAGLDVSLNLREVKYEQGSVLVSGRHRRVASRGIERSGLPLEVAAQIEDEFKKENSGKSVPDERYRERRKRPLLLIHLIEPNSASLPSDGKPPEDTLVALGLSFPAFDDSDVAKQVKYVVNLVEWNSIIEAEIDDFFEDDPEDDAR